MGFTTQSTTRPASTSTSTYYRASFDSIHTVNGSSGPPPSTRSSMAPRSFRLGGSSISSSSSSSSVYPPARQTPPPSTGSFSATRNPVFDSASTRPVAPSYPSVSAASNSATFSQDGSSLYPGSKKRTRVMTTDHQVARLNEVLAQTMFPTTSQREQLAQELDMTPRRIQVWFQNKRQSLRKRREEEESSSLSRQHSYDEDEEEDALSVGTKAHSHSPGFATLPPLDTTFPRERTPYYSSAGFPSSSNTPPLSATTSASNQSLFTSYREPETPATPAFSPYEAPSKDFSGSGLRKSASYLDPSPLSTTATPLSRSTSGGTSLGAGPSSSRCNILPPARSSSPYRSSSPAGLRSSVGPSSGMSSLSLQQSAYGATLPSNQRTSPPRSSLGQSVRLPPARELMREADAIMMGPEAGAVPSRTRRPSFSSCWGR